MKNLFTLIFTASLTLSFVFSNTTEKKIYTAQHINPHPPTIDGKLHDEVWQKGSWEKEFIQREPYEGEAPSLETTFKILYDDKNLYVAIRAFYNKPKDIV